MVRMFLLLPLLLAGCQAFYAAEGVLAGVDLAAIPVIHRDLPDAIFSDATGRDCSVVRLDHGESYCRPIEALPTVPPYCTKSLGQVDCWYDQTGLGRPTPQGVADGPYSLTPTQNADRLKRWPGLF